MYYKSPAKNKNNDLSPLLGMKFLLFSFGLGIVFLVTTVPAGKASAQEDPYLECADIKKSKARLKCYDAVLQKQHPELIEKIEEAAKVQAREDFALQSVPDREKGEKRLKYVDVVIVEYAKDRFGKWLLITEDGQVWKQTDSLSLQLRGQKIKGRFKRGLAGSYFFSLEGKKYGIKVKRVR
ncbi:MAG: hypothetical protein V3R20_05020 [Sphingomonadales bacterium]